MMKYFIAAILLTVFASSAFASSFYNDTNHDVIFTCSNDLGIYPRSSGKVAPGKHWSPGYGYACSNVLVNGLDKQGDILPLCYFNHDMSLSAHSYIKAVGRYTPTTTGFKNHVHCLRYKA